MQLHTWGCTDPVRLRDSELKVDSGEKICCHIRDSNPHQYCAWLFSRTATNELSLPSVVAVAGLSFADLGTLLTATSFQAVSALSSFVTKYSLKYAYVFVSARFCYCDWRLIRASKSVCCMYICKHMYG